MSYEQAVVQASHANTEAVLHTVQAGELDLNAAATRFDSLTTAWAADGYGATPNNLSERTQLPDINTVGDAGQLIKISQLSGENVYPANSSGGQAAERSGHYRVLIGEEQRDIEILAPLLAPKSFRLRSALDIEPFYDVKDQTEAALSDDMRWLVASLGQAPLYGFDREKNDKGYLIDSPRSEVIAVTVPVVQNQLARDIDTARDEAYRIENRAKYEAGQHIPKKLGLFALKGEALAKVQQDAYGASIEKQNTPR